MVKSNDSTGEGGQGFAPRVVAIIANNRIVEIWRIHLLRTDYRERTHEFPKRVRTRVVGGRPEHCEVHRTQLARQEWGRFVIRRYQAARMLPWTPSLALMMLIPGTLLAAGSANQGIMEAPLGLLVLECTLITLGGLLAVASGWPILTKRVRSADGIPLESLGVSGHALGFPADVQASDVLMGCRPSRFKGDLEVDAPVGPWQVVEEHTTELGWHRPS